jgi:hypothetical protein
MMDELAISLGFPCSRRLHGLHADNRSVWKWWSLEKVEQRRKGQSTKAEKGGKKKQEKIRIFFLRYERRQSDFCMRLVLIFCNSFVGI